MEDKAGPATKPPPKQKAKKPAGPAEEEDPDLVNPNRLPVNNLSLKDIDTPLEMSRRERSVVPLSLLRIALIRHSRTQGAEREGGG